MCPRLPVDGKKVSELRITFGRKERELIQELETSYRIQSVFPSIADILTDGTSLYVIGSIYEIMTGRDLPWLINPMEAVDFWNNMRRESKENPNPFNETLGPFGTIFSIIGDIQREFLRPPWADQVEEWTGV